MNCPFSTLSKERIVLPNSFGSVICDGYPISPGHTFVIPHRHIRSFFEPRLMKGFRYSCCLKNQSAVWVKNLIPRVTIYESMMALQLVKRFLIFISISYPDIKMIKKTLKVVFAGLFRRRQSIRLYDFQRRPTA